MIANSGLACLGSHTAFAVAILHQGGRVTHVSPVHQGLGSLGGDLRIRNLVTASVGGNASGVVCPVRAEDAQNSTPDSEIATRSSTHPRVGPCKWRPNSKNNWN